MSETTKHSGSDATIPMVIDPDYSAFIVKARLVAKSEGYAIAIHGSTTRDLDLIAVPWIATPRLPAALACQIAFNTGWLIQKSDGTRAGIGERVEPAIREHGRMVWTFLPPSADPTSPDWPDPRFVDFSVIPPNAEAGQNNGGKLAATLGLAQDALCEAQRYDIAALVRDERRKLK